MTASTRAAPAAFGRGMSQLVANPLLLLAPLAFGGVTAVGVGALGAAALFGGFAAFSSRGGFRRGPAAIPDFFEGLRGSLLSSPGTVLLLLLAILVLVLLLTALAAWVRAGLTGALAEADAQAGEDAPVDAFRLPGAGATFFRWAGQRFGSFFALVNLYALVASFLAAFLLVPLAGVFAGAFGRNPGLLAISGAATLLSLPILVAGGAALRVLYLAAGRTLVAEPALDALGAVARAVALVREAPGRTTVLYLLTIAGGMAVAAAFVLPRLALTILAGEAHAGLWAPLAVAGAFGLLQVLAALAYEVVVTGSFVALWPAPVAAGRPAAAEVSPS